MRVNGWASSAAIGLEVVMIAAAIGAASWAASPWITVAAIILVGARQHALLVLMHDATHRSLYADRQVNDVVGELLAWSLGITLNSYRAEHFAHHQHLNGADDPDWARTHGEAEPRAHEWRFPASPRRIARLLLRDVTGLDTGQQILDIWRYAGSGGQEGVRRLEPVLPGWLRGLVFAGLAGVLTWTGAWSGFVLFWIIPALTWLKMALRLRYMAEHFAVPGSLTGDGTRTTIASWWERLLIAPLNIGYHVEHHRHPSVPQRSLVKLHELMLAKACYGEGEHWTTGYVSGALGELSAYTHGGQYGA